jgi:hypothetical protein
VLQHRTGNTDGGCAKQGAGIDFQLDATTDGGPIKIVSVGRLGYGGRLPSGRLQNSHLQFLKQTGAKCSSRFDCNINNGL